MKFHVNAFISKLFFLTWPISECDNSYFGTCMIGKRINETICWLESKCRSSYVWEKVSLFD